MGRALNRRATRTAHFSGVVQLTLGVDRFRGALELPETWEIVGPTRPRAHLRQSAYADRLRHPRRRSEPVTAIRLGHSGLFGTRFCRKSDRRDIYPIYRHAPCANDPNSQRQCKYEEVFCIGRVEDTMVLTSERRQIEDLILTISYAEFRQELGPECQP